MRNELQGVSESRLRDYLQAKQSVLAGDPILATYHDLASKEKERRAALVQTWGKASPKMPSPLAMQVSLRAQEVEAGAKAVGRGVRAAEKKIKGLKGVLRR